MADWCLTRVGIFKFCCNSGSDNLHQELSTAVINKRASGLVLIKGRKSFQKPSNEGIALLNAIRDVYLDNEITVA